MCAAITTLPGNVSVAYDSQEDLFTMRFDPHQTRLEDIFTAVHLAGRQAGRDYFPRLVP
ncbi:MAG: hypothetical protein WBV23_02800 [Desulfobaccales bacterium]